MAAGVTGLSGISVVLHGTEVSKTERGIVMHLHHPMEDYIAMEQQ